MLSFYDFLWWLPVSIAIPHMSLPEAFPALSLVHLYATYSAIYAAGWESWWRTLLGTFLLSKAMGLAHESIWDAFEPLIIGKPGHGAGVDPVRHNQPSVLDKDGQPLGPQSVLLPGTQLRVDRHDGKGFRPHVIPGRPVSTNERRAIEAFFTQEERDALKAAGVEPWHLDARKVLPKERCEELREEHGLWRDDL